MIPLVDLPMRNFKQIALASALLWPSAALAHPHAIIEANLEIVRDDSGAATELRHVWRFDEMFSTSVLLDFDANADNALQPEELEEVSKVVTLSIGEQGWFTEVRSGNDPVEIVGPDKIMVDYQDGQLLMFFAAKLKEPVSTVTAPFRVSVADPTYWVAVEIADPSAVQITGNGAACQADIARPDYDKLLAENPDSLTEEFFTNPQNASLTDQWMSWITIKCA
jgi:ABC-type uncharacterized transport system substrate-binding protein